MKYFALIILLILCSCQDKNFKKDFYTEQMREADVWRLPIIEPFELLSAYCCKTWNLYYPDSIRINLLADYPIDSINVTSNYIKMHSPGNAGMTWGILDLKRKIFLSLDKKFDFDVALDSIGISNKLYSTDSVYNYWKATKKLPWIISDSSR